MTLRVLITGPGHVSLDPEDFDAALRELADRMGALLVDGWQPAAVVTRGYPGVEASASAWALARGIGIVRVPPDWTRFGPRAQRAYDAQCVAACDAAIVWWCPDGGDDQLLVQLGRAGKPHVVKGWR